MQACASLQTLVVSPGDASVWSYHRWLCHAAVQHATPADADRAPAAPAAPDAAQQVAELLAAEEARCASIVASEEARQSSGAAAMLGDGALRGSVAWPLQVSAELSALQRRLQALQVRAPRACKHDFLWQCIFAALLSSQHYKLQHEH
jgi:hypothetical protein